MNPGLILRLLSLGSRGLKRASGLVPGGYTSSFKTEPGRILSSNLFKGGRKLENMFKKRYTALSRKSLKKELLSKPSYNRFLESRKVSRRGITRETQELINEGKFHNKQIKFWLGQEKHIRDAIGLQGSLTGAPTHIHGLINTAITRRLAHENMRRITSGKLENLGNELTNLKLSEVMRGVGLKGKVSYKAYKKDVASAIDKTPVAFERSLMSEGRPILGVYNPMGRDVRLDTARILRERTFRGKSTGRHELKHATQHQTDPGGAYERIFKANYPKGFTKKHYSKHKEYYDERLGGYSYSQIPEEASARLSEIRGLSPSVLRKIRNNPGGRRAQSIAPVRWLTTVFGTGDKFRKILDKAWALPVAYGAKRSLLDEAVGYTE